jgi:hypothetical protein
MLQSLIYHPVKGFILANVRKFARSGVFQFYYAEKISGKRKKNYELQRDWYYFFLLMNQAKKSVLLKYIHF